MLNMGQKNNKMEIWAILLAVGKIMAKKSMDEKLNKEIKKRANY